MDNILIYLEKIIIPSTQKRSNMSGVKYRGADNRLYGNSIKSVTLGEVRDWKTGGKCISKFTKLHPHLWELLKEIKDFKSVCINHNTVALPHRDKNNKGESTIIAIGDFTGGELVVENKVIDIHNKFFSFNGSQKLHWNLPFVGNRYSIIFFD